MTGDESLMEKTLAEEKIFDGHVVHLQRATVELPSGRTATREVVRHVGAAAVVAVDENGRVAMVLQWRYALGRALFEIPAGKLDAFGADKLEAAKRELREETGHRDHPRLFR
jgi:ADP-ribose pyrophosphatase